MWPGWAHGQGDEERGESGDEGRTGAEAQGDRRTRGPCRDRYDDHRREQDG